MARIGALRSLFHSAAGKMLLTTLTQREIALLLRRANATAGSTQAALELPAVLHEIELVRQQGYALSQGTSMPGAAALAILLPAGRDHPPLTLSVGGPLNEITATHQDLLKVLTEAAEPFQRSWR